MLKDVKSLLHIPLILILFPIFALDFNDGGLDVRHPNQGH